MKSFKVACNTSSVHKGAAIRLFHFFIIKTASAVLHAWIIAERLDKMYSCSASRKTRSFNIYPQLLNFLLKKYVTDQGIAETESDIPRFAKPSNMKPFQNAEELVTKTVCCGDVFGEHALNKILTGGLDVSIYDSMREYWKNKQNAKLHDLVFQATSLLQLQGHDVASKRTNTTESKHQKQRGKLWSSFKSGINTMKSKSTSSPSASTKNTLSTPVLTSGHPTTQSSPASLEALSSLVASLDDLSTMENSAHYRVFLPKNHKTSQCAFVLETKRNAFTSFHDANFKVANSPRRRKRSIRPERFSALELHSPWQLVSSDNDVHDRSVLLGVATASSRKSKK